MFISIYMLISFILSLLVMFVFVYELFVKSQRRRVWAPGAPSYPRHVSPGRSGTPGASDGREGRRGRAAAGHHDRAADMDLRLTRALSRGTHEVRGGAACLHAGAGAGPRVQRAGIDQSWLQSFWFVELRGYSKYILLSRGLQAGTTKTTVIAYWSLYRINCFKSEI